MSVISEKNRYAIYAKLNVPAVTSLAANGVHFQLAPDGQQTPYVVFTRVPSRIDYALGNNIVGEYDLWLIKAIADKASSETMSPVQLAEEILTQCDESIGGSLTISGNINRMARRVSEMPPYLEKVSDRHFYHHGFYLAVYTE